MVTDYGILICQTLLSKDTKTRRVRNGDAMSYVSNYSTAAIICLTVDLLAIFSGDS